MSLALVFRSSARADIAESYQWYERARSGTGEAFLLEVHRCLAYIIARPRSFPRVHGELRQASVAKFPFVVVYRARSKEVVIMRVFHCRRDPGKKVRRATR